MAYPRKLPSGRWQATVKHPSGKRYTKSDPLKRVVMEWAAELEQQIRRGEFVDPNAGKMTVARWWDRWQTTQVVELATSRKRESLWRVHLAGEWGTWPLASIQSWDVETWVAKMAKAKVGQEAQASAFRLMKQLLGDAVRHRLIRANPCELVEGPKSPKHVDRFLSLEESDRLLAAVTRPGPRKGIPRNQKLPRVPDPEQRLFVQLMLEAGLRWEEAAGLHVFRVDLMRRVVRVQEVARRDRSIKPIPKSKAGQRVVPLVDDLVDELSRHLAGRPRDGLVFPDGDGLALDYSNWLKRVWAPAVSAAGLVTPLPTPHDCRHSYGTWLAEQGVPPHEIAALMGHGSLRAVEKYIHAGEARMERARKALGARRAHETPRRKRKAPSPGAGNGA